MRNKDNDYKSKYYTNVSIREKIDKRLHKIAALNANIGSDSTEKEKEDIYKQIGELGQQIKDIDSEFYEEISIAN